VFSVLNRFNIIIIITIVNIFSSSWYLADDFETSAFFFFCEILKYVVGYRDEGFRAELLVLMEEIW
jgi:hypothetical protein